MFVLAVTGSLGAGKTSVATEIAFRTKAPLFNADNVVHELYYRGGKAFEPVVRQFPEALDPSGEIDRKKLSELLADDPKKFKKLNNIVHPLVSKERNEFIKQHKKSQTQMVVLDIPLLFEGGIANKRDVDTIVVVNAPKEVRRKRLKRRANMSVGKFNMLEARQLPIKDKRKQADYFINNNGDWSRVRQYIRDILEAKKFEINGNHNTHHRVGSKVDGYTVRASTERISIRQKFQIPSPQATTRVVKK